jgi:hypothetical protein
VPVIVAGFIATLKVAVTGALGHAPVEAFRGATEATVGVAKPGLAPGLQHPGLKMTSKNAGNQILALLYLRMTVILFPLGPTAAAQWNRNPWLSCKKLAKGPSARVFKIAQRLFFQNRSGSFWEAGRGGKSKSWRTTLRGELCILRPF